MVIASQNDRPGAAGPLRRGPGRQRIELLIAGLEGLSPLAPPAVGAGTMDLAAKVFAIVTRPGPGGLDRPEFWRHCLATAAAAEMIADRLAGGIAAAAAFACGLLHDIGKFALDECLPKSYRRVLAAAGREGGDIADHERRIIGLDHTIVGRRVARRWGLGREIQEAVWLHHQPSGRAPVAPPDTSLSAVVQLADALARELGIGFSGNHDFARSGAELAEAIGLSRADLRAVVEELPACVDRHAAATAEAVAARDRRPAPAGAAPGRPEADILEVLKAFSERAAEAASPGELCGEIARTFSAGLPDGPAITGAFAIIPDEDQLILATPGSEGAGAFRVFPCRPMGAGPGGRPRPADEVLETLVGPEAVAEVAGVAGWVCVPLTAGGKWVGGVLLDGREGPAGFAGEVVEAFGTLAALVLASALDRARADRLAEQLAGAYRNLARAQAELADARALATVGEMAAGAAHEINNPLAVISGRAQLLAGRADSDEVRAAAELIAEKAAEASDIVTQLAAFARPPEAEAARVAVSGLLESVKATTDSWEQSKTDALKVDIHTEPGCPAAVVDAGQIAEVLVELVRNASTAAAGPVRVRIDAGRGPQPGAAVLIRVSDDGPGMDAATAASVFTPFYSHRPAGRGRGMGMALARRTIETNGGRMWIDSRVEKGTTVFVRLPAESTQ